MGPSPGPTLPGRTVYRLLFLQLALDSLVIGLWALLLPHHLFTSLQLPLPGAPSAAHGLPHLLSALGPQDGLVLWRLLGVLALVHVGVVAVLVWKPQEYGSLAVVPLAGRALGAALWLWAASTDRLVLPTRQPLWLLFAHDALWLPLLLWFLLAWYLWRVGSGRSGGGAAGKG